MHITKVVNYIVKVDTKTLVSFGLPHVMEKNFKSELHLSSNESYRIYFMESLANFYLACEEIRI